MGQGATAIAAVALAGVLAGCGPEVPANPTYEQHVRPILQARCVRCHSNPPVVEMGAPMEPLPGPMDFVTEAELRRTENAGAFAFIIAAYAYAKGQVNPPGIMPPAPAAPLEDWQIETLERWSLAQQP